MVKKVNFKTTKGILQEIEDTVNEFKQKTEDIDSAEVRVRGCNSAIKVHMLDYLNNQFELKQQTRRDKIEA